MAELLVGQGWAVTDPLALYLRDALPEDYIVVSEPIVQREAFDALVVGPQGIFVMHGRDAPAGRSGPQAAGWRRILSSRRRVDPELITEGFRAQRAMRAFLRDEFPEVHPMIRDFPVWALPGPAPKASDPLERPPLTKEAVAEAIMTTKGTSQWVALDAHLRETLALALRERQLTVSQRAGEPFIFRSGGPFESGRRVWTVRDAINYMDLHPDDGVYHLLNGTLEQWLEEQGATHLSALVRSVTQQRENDPRVSLESFLLGSGVVPRPRLSADPALVDLGYVLVGQSASSHLRVFKGRGRGYLFGSLHTSEPWLRVEPKKLAGKPLDAVVTANTEGLPISSGPRRAEVHVTSNASEELTVIPVQLQVMAKPSRLNRYLLRPLAGMVSAGVLGAGLGWLLWSAGIGRTEGTEALRPLQLPPGVVWPALFGLFWALMGAIRGITQPLAWPSSYTLKRLGLRTLAWALTMGLLASTAFWGLRQLVFGLGVELPNSTGLNLFLLAPAFAVLPAIVGELQESGPRADASKGPDKRMLEHPLFSTGVILALVFVLLVGTRVLAPSWRAALPGGQVTRVQQWAGAQWSSLGHTVDGVWTRLTLFYYDRRVPARPRTPTTAPKVQPTVKPAP